MPNTEERELKKGSGCGLAVVIGLAVIFFVLMVLLIGECRRDEPARVDAGPSELFVIPARLRIRVQPSAKSPVIDHASRGEKLKVVESRGAWVRVETPRRLTGWAERNALEREEARNRRLQRTASIRKLPPLPGLVLERAPLYSGPGLFFSVVGELQPNVRVNIFTRDHDFYAIDAAGEIAYVEVDAVDISSTGDTKLDVAAAEEPASSTAPPEPTETATETIEPPAAEPPQVAASDDGVFPAVPPGGEDPVVVDRVVPSYPAAARRAGIEGRVVLRGIVRKNGRIDSLEIVKDQPYGLGDDARVAVRRWRFRPATVNGQPIDVYYTVTVNYRLTD